MKQERFFTSGCLTTQQSTQAFLPVAGTYGNVAERKPEGLPSVECLCEPFSSDSHILNVSSPIEQEPEHVQSLCSFYGFKLMSIHDVAFLTTVSATKFPHCRSLNMSDPLAHLRHSTDYTSSPSRSFPKSPSRRTDILVRRLLRRMATPLAVLVEGQGVAREIPCDSPI